MQVTEMRFSQVQVASMTRTIHNPDLEASRATTFTTLFTLVLWIICVSVGFIGFVFPYIRPKAPVAAPSPIQAELIKIELTESEILPEKTPEPSAIPQPSSLQPIEIPKAPPLIAVAEPSPEIAFALPIEGPARIVDVKSAAASRPVEQASTAPTPTVQTLKFGSGEGKQPAPEYPARARREGQEGVVLVRFMVGENGRVLSAEAASPSPWPLLNESAVRAIRERWRFNADSLRLYEVAIRFQLKK